MGGSPGEGSSCTSRPRTVDRVHSWGSSHYEELTRSGRLPVSPLDGTTEPLAPPESPSGWPTDLMKSRLRTSSSSTLTGLTTPNSTTTPTSCTTNTPTSVSTSKHGQHRRRASAGQILDTPTRVSRAFQTIDRITTKFQRSYKSRAGSLDGSTTSRRFGMDLTGLRKALCIRLVGVEVAGVPRSGGIKNPSPVSWIRRRASSGGNAGDFAMVVVWVSRGGFPFYLFWFITTRRLPFVHYGTITTTYYLLLLRQLSGCW